ncbi:MAG: HEPN domain-containing protein [bacterium]
MNGEKAEPAVLMAMLDKADEKLQAAQRELKDKFYGESASRAYYAVFHAVCAVLAGRGLSFASHSQAIGAFNREFIKTGIFPGDTARKIQRLFEDRQTADYDWSIHVDEATAIEDVHDAEWLVSACRKHLVQTGFLNGDSSTNMPI